MHHGCVALWLAKGASHPLPLGVCLGPLPQVVALHKERYVFPVTLKVTRISGTGVDAIFMGVMKVSTSWSPSTTTVAMPLPGLHH